MDFLKKENMTRRRFVQEIAGAAFCCACLELDCLAAPAVISKNIDDQSKKVQETGTGKENLVAVCGLYCGACPMYIATQTNDEQKQSALLKQFSSGPMKFKMEDLLCDGCIGNGRVASFCRSCPIRSCPADKQNVARCSDCPDFPCSRISNFNNDGMLHHAEVLQNLRQIREMGIQKWAKYEEERWRCPQCRMPMSWYDSKCSKCGTPRSERLFPLPQANKQP
jgi:hypothetical protein